MAFLRAKGPHCGSCCCSCFLHSGSSCLMGVIGKTARLLRCPLFLHVDRFIFNFCLSPISSQMAKEESNVSLYSNSAVVWRLLVHSRCSHLMAKGYSSKLVKIHLLRL